jgi:hypothetical protein
MATLASVVRRPLAPPRVRIVAESPSPELLWPKRRGGVKGKSEPIAETQELLDPEPPRGGKATL